jgi:hypothetical protein
VRELPLANTGVLMGHYVVLLIRVPVKHAVGLRNKKKKGPFNSPTNSCRFLFARKNRIGLSYMSFYLYADM